MIYYLLLFFLDEKSDSMGAYRNRENMDGCNGEAIIEIRSIQNIGNFFLTYFLELNAEEVKGQLLTEADKLEYQATSLLAGLSLFEQLILDDSSCCNAIDVLAILANKRR